jgi:hypothetical protein
MSVRGRSVPATTPDDGDGTPSDAEDQPTAKQHVPTEPRARRNLGARRRTPSGAAGLAWPDRVPRSGERVVPAEGEIASAKAFRALDS